MYTIKEVAERLQLKPHTLRYYEQEGILTPARQDNGRRVYSEQDLKGLQFVQKLRETQMPIAKIKEYVQLAHEGEHTAQERLAILEKHRTFIQTQLKQLMATEELIDYKVETYKRMIEEKDTPSPVEQ
ncbi:MerR family transcriptional regulator [Pontibacillus halophilus JSM 076056 = DSM 19796]|uniref:MerR family transcriptional regulator n=1 Tax=Pontibacillus halophilus JSM 076056 = DSM 19796 TaxID=1385510 RepID=A0A0A5GF24_9BACI|nr:MerR family transcriptional regulator [Pontibacillus halophilus]KGX89720.1 MerR family transcriptional regulator [Pontibacillus halophilus JSM 076056 = DSM 19796]